MRRYTEYKDTGAKWIGRIPSEWNTIRFKFLNNGLNTGEGIDKEYWTDDQSECVFYTAGLEPIYTSYKEFPEWKYTNKNDLLLARNGTPYVYYPPEGACYSDHIIRAEIKEKNDKRFVRYCLQQSIMSMVIDTVSIATWSASLWNEQIVPWPSIEEQHRIADYLDKKTDHIDNLIDEAKASIDEYKAWKASIIYEAVTKGLDKDVEMKDSGIEWIGMIPSEWKIARIKAIVTLIESGVSVNAGQNPAGPEKKGVLKTSSVSKKVFLPDENKEVNPEEINRVSCPVCANTIIVSRMNTPELVGAAGYVEKNYPNLFLPDRLWQVHFSDKMEVKFVWYYLCSNYIGNYYASLASGTSSSMQNISQGQFLGAYIVLPEKAEQKQIVHFLDVKCESIDKLISEKESLILDLEAYKKSLIFETVTGKRKVV